MNRGFALAMIVLGLVAYVEAMGEHSDTCQSVRFSLPWIGDVLAVAMIGLAVWIVVAQLIEDIRSEVQGRA